MAWNAPATAVTGDVIPASFWNTNGRDNLNETLAAKVTTAGDMGYATGANALAPLAIGAQGTLLRSTGSAPAWFAKGSANYVLQVNAGATDIEYALVGFDNLSLAQGSSSPAPGTPTAFAVQQYAFASPASARPGTGASDWIGVNYLGYNLWDDNQAARSWYTAGQGTGGCQITWDYITASGHPRIWAAIDKDGQILAMWEAEDPADDEDPDACPIKMPLPPGGAFVPLSFERDFPLAKIAELVAPARPSFLGRGKWADAGQDPQALLALMHADYAGRRHFEQIDDIDAVVNDLPLGDERTWRLQLWLRCASRVINGHRNYSLIDLMQSRFVVTKQGRLVLKD